MLLSLFLSNWFLCGIAILLLVPLLRSPYMLTYHRGIPVFILISVIACKMFLPYEFPFTLTFPSKSILPFVRGLWSFDFFEKETVGQFLIFLWLFIAALLMGLQIISYRKLMLTLSIVPETKSKEIVSVLSALYLKKPMAREPKVVQLDTNTGPFAAGLLKPVVVLPKCQMSECEMKYILEHELEHIANHHIVIKISIEVIAAVFWWNPLIWLLRREAIHSLEVQADIRCIQTLTGKEKLSYLEALISVARNIQGRKRRSFALSFAIDNNMLEYRVHTALKHNCYRENKRAMERWVCALVLSLLFALSSFLFTFAAYSADPSVEADTFAITPQNAYFIRDNGRYDLYVDRKFVGTLDHKPDEFSDLSIYD